MIKKVIGCWAFWGVYGYVIGPAIDNALAGSKNEYVQAAKAINKVYAEVNKLCFIAPMALANAAIETIKTKVAE